MTMNDIVKRAHFIKHSHGRSVAGVCDKILHGGSIWTGQRTFLYFFSANQYFFTLYIMI